MSNTATPISSIPNGVPKLVKDKSKNSTNNKDHNRKDQFKVPINENEEQIGSAFHDKNHFCNGCTDTERPKEFFDIERSDLFYSEFCGKCFKWSIRKLYHITIC